MKRTTLLALAVLAGWAVTAAAQTPEPADQAKNTLEQSQVQKRTETQAREQVEARGTGQRFVDADGDGICDNCRGSGQGNGAAKGRRGRGPGDGTGNQGVGPRDGSGFGTGARSGNCDGTGPKGRGSRGGGGRR
jgi:hypothetical protein